jgi:hypothetical protein
LYCQWPAELRVLVHLARADLHFHAALLRADDGGVDRAIEVAFGRGDVVVELAGDVGPQPVHDAERRVALGHRVHHDAHGAHVENFFEGQVLSLHLPVDAVDVLGPPIHLRFHVALLELRAQRGAHLFDVALAIGATLVQRGGDAAIFVGLEVAEGEVFQLPLELPHAQAVGERRQHRARLHGQPLPGFGRKVFRMSKPHELLRELGEHQTRVAHHGQQHLAHGLGLARVEALCRRPVPRQAHVANALQVDRDLRRARGGDAGELLLGEAVEADQGTQHQRARKLRVFRERADDFGGLHALRECFARHGMGGFSGRAHASDGGENVGRAELGGFHGKIRIGLS